MPTVIVGGERVALTAPEREEFVDRWRLFDDPVLAMLLGSPTIGEGPEVRTMPPATREQREALYEEHARRRLLYFDLRLPGDDFRCVGEGCLSGLSWPRAAGEVSVVVFAPEDRGNGLGAEAATLLCAYAFDGLGLNRISARFSVDNAAAAAAAKRVGPGVGAREVGVEREAEWAFGRHRDVALWEVLKREFPPHPATKRLREPPDAL
ncbi:MAG TPA: GNAT family protein [Thermoleophilaceae bacterium]|jgi:RimJ/RimL family protein N-acetyltransferase